MSVLDKYSERVVTVQPWLPHEIYDLSNTKDQVNLEDAFQNGQITRIVDPFEATANALYEYENPSRRGPSKEREEFISELANQGEEFGSWVYFPWDQSLVRYPNQEQHFKLRTSRNRNLTTLEQQTRLYRGKTIAALGLSVGQPIVKTMVEAGLGDTYCLADFDRWSPDNLNRTDATQADVGGLKIDELSKYISKKDPWIKQVRFVEGINKENIQLLDGVLRPDLIVEEVDNMSVKALARDHARKLGVPLLMAADIDTTSAIDVERYDLRDKRKIVFGGKLSATEVESLLSSDADSADNTSKMLKHIGVQNLSTAMLKSSMERDVTLSGLPQLGMTARRGGANVTFAAREILLGRKLASGRYIDDPRKVFNLGRATTLVEHVGTILEVVKYMKKLKQKQS